MSAPTTDDRCQVCRRPFAEHRIYRDELPPSPRHPGVEARFTFPTSGVYCPTNIPRER